jgi:exonuclease III
MWEAMTNTFEHGQTYIMGGDWNMTEQDGDKSSGCSRKLSHAECNSWSLLKSSLDVQDHFCAGQNLRYSWDNGRIGARILARLDRFYISNRSCTEGIIEEYRIRGDCRYSDHLLVGFCMNLGAAKKQPSCYKMNSVFFKEPDVKAEYLGSGRIHQRMPIS